MPLVASCNLICQGFLDRGAVVGHPSKRRNSVSCSHPRGAELWRGVCARPSCRKRSTHDWKGSVLAYGTIRAMTRPASSLGSLELATLTALLKMTVEIKTRLYGLRKYPECFVGSEATSCLRSLGVESDDGAVELGRRMVEDGFIGHVCDDHTFKNEYLFYVFHPCAPSDLCADDYLFDYEVLENILKEELQPQDRWQNGRLYRQCFLGNQAVDVLVAQDVIPSTLYAVFVGNILMERGLFSHVSGDSFKNEKALYRFTGGGAGPGPVGFPLRPNTISDDFAFDRMSSIGSIDSAPSTRSSISSIDCRTPLSEKVIRASMRLESNGSDLLSPKGHTLARENSQSNDLSEPSSSPFANAISAEEEHSDVFGGLKSFRTSVSGKIQKSKLASSWITQENTKRNRSVVSVREHLKRMQTMSPPSCDLSALQKTRKVQFEESPTPDASIPSCSTLV